MPSIHDYDYHLPAHLIAQEPSPVRDRARLLVVDRAQRTLTHSHFHHLSAWLGPQDVLVINNTRVFPARLRGRKASGGRVEILLLAPPQVQENGRCPRQASGRGLWRASKPPRPGQQLLFGTELTAAVTAVTPAGEVELTFQSRERDLRQVWREVGEMPLPPYIRRPAAASDRQRYQTIFASQEGAVAAPTAGLHFTPQVLQDLAAKGVTVVPLTLHVGPGTFQPVREDDYTRHRLAPEYFSLSPESAATLNQALAAGKKIVAVGTTSVRVLESQYHDGQLHAGEGWCDLFIQPGYQFQVVNRLLTNFHLPKTTLLLLVSAFAGRDFILQAYQAAVAQEYRFYSYGDCMLIL
uniref:tRNA preQ1(34) S-adenosylmethionine ribosyltransferase-isomerase QueA n=1 Tax=Desulfobacca sp. TaxID=2067990 RepID=UPI00404B7059